MTRGVKRALASTGLLPAVRRVRRSLWLATDPTIRQRVRQYREGFDRFRARYEHVLRPGGMARPEGDGARVVRPGAAAGALMRTALVAGSACPTLEVELALIVALRLSGCRTVVVLQDHWRMLRPYYRLAGVEEVHLWSDYEPAFTRRADAAAALDRCRSLEDVVGLTHAGIRVGQAAVSTAFRRHRVGSLDWRVAADRRTLAQGLDVSLTVADQANRMLTAIRPDVALFWDTEYSPTAELFDGCTGRGVDTIAYRTAHLTNGLIFKRYSPANRDEQVSSLSAASWATLQRMEWSSAERAKVDREIASSYARGDWFKECWTQSLARLVAPGEVRAALGLDPAKKTAVVFSHILWDAPLSWAKPLFPTYEEWLIATVRAACANDRVNWVIKIHPANVGKGAREGYAGEAAEVLALRSRLGDLPPHVVVLPPDTGMNALSVFQVMDYCVTVRGTVGIEAARLGVPVLTAAEARYSGRGFTVDSSSQAEYLDRLGHIQDTLPLSAAERELAERFAYGMFVERPLVMQSVTWDYGEMGQPPRADIHVRAADDWTRAPDVAALVAWIRDSRDEDFLATAATRCPVR